MLRPVYANCVTPDCLGVHPQQSLSPGQGIKAMILNGLGFLSAPLYLYEGFFENKAVSHLLGESVTAAHLNDDYLGRLLDKVWDYGVQELFSLIAMDACHHFQVKSDSYHLDSTSISVYGDYEPKPESSQNAPELTYGGSDAL